ncbi:hypothetical protein ACJRO7_010367 [Eucalyptus globulus]|uniref:Disease resistance protein RGA3 n=1 Tax=Eucalyptus globulus TaxID=34317 RepID=A0ABD3LBT4_EUCGL
MAEAVIFSIAGEIVASLAPQAIENIGKLWGDKHELEALRETVSTLQAVLDDAEERYYWSREIKDWVDRLKGAFYDALDVLEEYNVEATRQGLRGHNKMFKEVRKFFSGSNQVAFILKMSDKVRAVKKRIETIEANRKFDLNTLPEREWRKREETHSFAREGDIIGRDDDKETVKKFLLNSDVKGNVSILPIVGIGGLGKTTLAQHVYNDKMVSEHFELKMWVCVSNDFDMKKIVKNILACVTKEELNHDSMEQLQNELRKRIDGRRYLLVLDDYWDVELETWLKLKTLLVEGARGSKILITTRLHLVADITCTTSPHLLGGLSKMESVDLLMQMAFPEGEEIQDPNLRPIGEEIARKCFGVPLVVRTVGSLLFKKTKAEWLRFKDYKLLEVSRSEEKIISVLRLSYNNLPSHLKQCFAFCSLFPKDHEIDKQTLVDLWVAEGFIKSSNTSEPLEDIAHEYFMNLIWSNFFQDFKKDPLTKRETCKMHDLMHDLACLVAGNECCVVGNDPKSIDARTRHISVGDLPLPFPHLEASRLRTLIFLKGRMISEEDLHPLMQSFKKLHVLDLHDTSVKKLPRSICELKYLTYLDLSYNMWLNRLPNSIMKLQNLQKLNLDGCCYLEELPRGITKLVSLRNLGIKDCERLRYVPRGLGQLSSLHRLNCFILPKDKARAKNYGKLEELYGLNNIQGSLYIENLGHVTDTIEEYKAANLTGKQSLESLELEWGGFNINDVVIGNRNETLLDELQLSSNLQSAILQELRNEALLDGLQPPSNLQELTITGYEGERFPRWMMDSLVSSLPNLVEVEFRDCRRCKRLSPLGQLPRLKSLRISRLAELEYVESGHSSTFTASFPSLLKLSIFFCNKLKAMPLTSHLGDNIFGQRVRHLPNFVDLSIEQCDELDLCKEESGGILDFQGLQNLRYVQIKNLPKLVYLPQWLVQASNLELCQINNSNLKALPEQIEAFQSLQRLEIVRCCSLTSLPKGMRRLASLTDLIFNNCKELDIFKDESGNILDFHGGLQSLHSVEICGLPKLTSLPQWLLQARNLECLLIGDCDNLKDIPEQIEALQSLQRLEITMSPLLTSLPKGMRRLASLTDLVFDGCKELDISKDESGNILDFHGGLQSLRSVTISLLPKLTSLPQWLLQLHSLERLQIWNCCNLKDIPEQIETLQSLQYLHIAGCYSLTSFPETMRRLTSLTHLKIFDCGELGESCKRQAGEDWDKVAHIPNIRFGGRIVR